MTGSSDELDRLITQCGDASTDPADLAMMRSLLNRVPELEALLPLIEKGVECRPFLVAVHDRIVSEGDADELIVRRLCEAMLFHDDLERADELASRLIRRHPYDSATIKLWASCASGPERVMSRFRDAISVADNPGEVLRDALFFAAHNQPAGLESIVADVARKRGISQ